MTDFNPTDHAASATTVASDALPADALPADGGAGKPREAERLTDLSSTQWKSGAAAWLGWLFDGLDMHLYTLVAAPFVAELLDGRPASDPLVGYVQLAGSKRRSWSAGRWAADSSAAWATASAAAGR